MTVTTVEALPRYLKAFIIDHVYDNIRLGEALQDERLRRGLSGTRVADRMKINQSSISRLETGQQHWNDDLLLRYLNAIDELEP